MGALIRSGRAVVTAIGVMFVAAGVFRAAGPVQAAETAAVATRDAVYAAFTVNLTRFISWPEAALGPAGRPFVIGTFPRDPINEQLDAAVQGEEVSGHPVRTIRLRSLEDIDKCQVIFFSRGMADPREVLARATGRPILTISDTGDFLPLGGQVRFVPEASRIGLRISAINLHAAGLQARAQLLRLAASP